MGCCVLAGRLLSPLTPAGFAKRSTERHGKVRNLWIIEGGGVIGGAT
jgi:hypothetical protein